jgi:hypothetical protein
MGFSDDNSPIYASYKKTPKGAYAKHPLATPKYALQKGPRGNDFTDTQARIYLSSPLKDTSKLGNLEPLANAVSDKTNGYVDFILQGVEQGLREKVDVIETLNDHYVAYFFGAAAEQWTFRGTFLNTKEDNQFLAFHEMYEKWLRGTKLADYRRIVALQYNGITVRGAITSLGTSVNSEMEMAIPFTFTLLVRDVALISEHDEAFSVVNGGESTPTTRDASAASSVAPDMRGGAVSPDLPRPALVDLNARLERAKGTLAARKEDYAKALEAEANAFDAILSVRGGVVNDASVKAYEAELVAKAAEVQNMPDGEAKNKKRESIQAQMALVIAYTESREETAVAQATVASAENYLKKISTEVAAATPGVPPAGDFTPQPVNVG